MVVSLPEELLEKVIVRVECIKSILRCIAVCKSWYALINSPRFTNIHMSRPSNNKYLLCYYEERTSPHTLTKKSYTIDCDNETFHEHCNLLALDMLPVRQLHSCNGLICYNYLNNPDHLYLWNPAIRKLKIIPESSNSSIRGRPDTFRLWFDTKSNDYKISTINYTRKAFVLELYSLSTNSWKLISENAPGAPRDLKCVNGILHWLRHHNDNWILNSLDAENGMFKETLITTWQSRTISLQSFGDRPLCILGYGDGNNCYCCRFILVYDESLNKVYTFDFRDNKIVNLMPAGFRNNGELLFKNIKDDRSIVSFNFETAEMKDYVQRTSRRSPGWVIRFVETLALLKDEDAMYEPNLSPSN